MADDRDNVVPLNRADRARQKKAKGKKTPPQKCKADTKKGGRCRYNAVTPDGYCRRHANPDDRKGRRPLLLQVVGRTEQGVEVTVQDTILNALRAGAYLADAAGAAGVGYSTVKEWIARGEEFLPDPTADSTQTLDEQLAELPDRLRLYAHFAAAATRARAQARVTAVGRIAMAASEDWRAAAWYLERTRPREFARVTRGVIAADASDAGGMTMAELAAMADEEGDP